MSNPKNSGRKTLLPAPVRLYLLGLKKDRKVSISSLVETIQKLFPYLTDDPYSLLYQRVKYFLKKVQKPQGTTLNSYRIKDTPIHLTSQKTLVINTHHNYNNIGTEGPRTKLLMRRWKLQSDRKNQNYLILHTKMYP